MFSKNPSLTEGNTLESRAPVDSCDDINSRSLFSIVWGCVTTIFACTWVSVHPNVPPPNQGRLRLFWCRLKMMLIAIIVPELMVGFAARQLWAARRFSKEFAEKGFPITLTHGFFMSMGGFVSGNGHPIVTIKQLTENAEYMSAIHDVEAEDISDKSKGDAFTKGIALLQGLWFGTQCLARAHQHLPITQLEVATLAFAVVNIFIWSLWWAKPLGVERPILVGPLDYQAFPSGPATDEAEPTILVLALGDKFFGVLTGRYSPYLPISSTSVPTFWSMNDDEATHAESYIPFYIECLVGTIFGAIHCAAWNAEFPSTIERWMWRSCSLMVATIPVALGFVTALYHATTPESAIGDTLDKIFTIILWVSILFYPIARLFLITIPFTSLRALLPEDYLRKTAGDKHHAGELPNFALRLRLMRKNCYDGILDPGT
ncbi:hypothetical protein C8R44DRAFT_848511 [Mycena epipterygia]|nr:hypothetical protein C8R44DRAFT_848511 [Mycena epipterygia]